MSIRWRIHGTLTTTAPLHIGNGDVVPLSKASGMLAADKKPNPDPDVQAVVRDHTGKPCIPGSAIKGVLRAWAEQYLCDNDLNRDRIRSLFGDRETSDLSQSGRTEFLTARMDMPQPDHLEALAKCVPHWNPEQVTGVMSHVAIDRESGVAKDGLLFFEEFVPEGVSFKVTIEWAGRSGESGREDVAFLLGLLERGAPESTEGFADAPLQFGANGADGWGRMTWQTTSTEMSTGPKCTQDGSWTDGYESADVDPSTPLVNFEHDRLVLDLELAFTGPMLVNDASRVRGRTEEDENRDKTARSEKTNFHPLRRVVQRDGKFGPGAWLPASSFRGALRSRVEFIVASLLNCDAATAAKHDSVVRLFGDTGRAARIGLDEFREVGQANLLRQDFVAIDRFTGGAAHGAKFDATFVDGPRVRTRICLDLRGRSQEGVDNKDEPDALDLALLAKALQDMCSGTVPLGFGGSKGYGGIAGRVALVKSPPLVSKTGKLHSIPWADLFATIPKNDGRDFVEDRLQETCRGDVPSRPLPTSVGKAPAFGGSPAAVPCVVAPTEKLVPGLLTITQLNPREWDYKVDIQSKKGKLARFNVAESEVRTDLRSKVTTSPIPVECVREGNSPVPLKVRPAGEPWGLPALNAPGDHPTAVPPANDRFIHPYYFVRMEDRAKCSPGPSDDARMADGPQATHAQLKRDRYSGTLNLRINTVTPLLVLDTASAVGNTARVTDAEVPDHYHYFTRRDGQDRPLVASSSVRGMLRAAYEVITNSRFGVFPTTERSSDSMDQPPHLQRLGYRATAHEGLGLVPVTIDQHGRATFRMGETSGLPTLGRNGRIVIPDNNLMYAAWVPMYNAGRGGPARDAIRIDGCPPRHGEPAWAWLELFQRGPFRYWRVRQAATRESELSPVAPAPSHSSGNHVPVGDALIKRRGWFCISNQNIDRKHDERFFFGDSTPVVVDPAVLQQFRDLIADYWKLHEDEVQERKSRGVSPDRYEGREPGKTAFSRHVYDDQKTTDGYTLCYAKVLDDASPRIVALYPVMISRKLFELAPVDLLPESLRPATKPDQLSPADRVFGWVAQTKPESTSDSVPARRSLLRVGPVTCESPDAIQNFEDKPLTLAILGQPKPHQGRFYLGDSAGKALRAGLSKEQTGYTEGNRIRGAKVYLHHAQKDSEPGFWNDEAAMRAAGVLASPDEEGNVKSNQNRSIRDWVKPGAEFTVDLRVTNLSAFELGALVWLLTMEDGHYLRLGLGKPVGFGSVRVTLDSSDIRSGTNIINQWTGGEPGEPVPDNEFKRCFEADANPDVLSAFLVASRGVPNLPVRYPPSQTPSVAPGKHYEWFVANEKDGATDRGRRLSLPDLVEGDISLPSSPVG